MDKFENKHSTTISCEKRITRFMSAVSNITPPNMKNIISKIQA